MVIGLSIFVTIIDVIIAIFIAIIITIIILRVSRFKLQLRDRQETRRSRGGGDDRPTPMAWGWSLDAAYNSRS